MRSLKIVVPSGLSFDDALKMGVEIGITHGRAAVSIEVEGSADLSGWIQLDKPFPWLVYENAAEKLAHDDIEREHDLLSVALTEMRRRKSRVPAPEPKPDVVTP